MPQNEEHFISGIFNYCDRWCERCEFTSRCRVFDGIADRNQKLREHTLDETLREVSENFEETLDMLQDMAEEQEFFLEEIDEEEQKEYEEQRERINRKVKEHPLVIESMNYLNMVRAWFDEHQGLIDQRLAELRAKIESGEGISEALEKELNIEEATEIIHFYQYPIPVKINRALHGYFDEQEEQFYEPGDIQTDFNGSAKVALIEMDRSLLAFELLRQNFPQKSNDWLPIMVHLQKLRSGLEKLMPDARRFIRPGFDE